MVDDTISRAKFHLPRAEEILDRRPDIQAFSFRMGRNITHGGKQPDFSKIDADILVWDTARSIGRYWNYFWEITGSLYRRETVAAYLAKCRPHRENFPNPFEDHFYTCMPTTSPFGIAKPVNAVRFFGRRKSHRLACFQSSKCFTQGINKVSASNNKGITKHTPEELHGMMQHGMVLDFTGITDDELNTPNASDRFLNLVKETELARD